MGKDTHAVSDPAQRTALEVLAANNVDISADQLTFGEYLKFDPATEKFIGNPEADKLLTRDYRTGFVVPEKV